MLTRLPNLSAKLDKGSGHALGIGFGFFGLVSVFVILFLAMVWAGRLRDSHRKDPRPTQTFPVLGTPGDERDPKTRKRRR